MRGLPKLLGRVGKPLPAVGQTPADVVHRENKWRLLRFRPREGGQSHRTPLLMVPSLINRWYVLDLLPGKSLTEYLVQQGHDVYVIDWGTPTREDRYVTFDEICDGYLGRAIRVACRTSHADEAHLLGYCMGGTLTAIHAAAWPERVASLVQLAAPIRFAEAGMMTDWMRNPGFSVDQLVDGLGNVPWQLMQSAFHLLRPTLNLSKAVHVLDRAWDDESLDGFLALEGWGNDNVSFPGECFRTYIKDLYQKDALVRGELSLSGRPALLSNIECPILCVTFEHDHIVPKRSAAALLDHVRSPDLEHLHLAGGHVGAVVSRSAAKRLWPKLSAFWAARDGARRDSESPILESTEDPDRESATHH